MKLTAKLPFATLTIGLVVITITGCAKKENITPATAANLPVAVYDAKNNAADYPTTGIVADASGNAYVANYASNIVSMITPKGVTTVIAGSGHIGSANGVGAAASFSYPQALAIDASNNIYVADSGNNLIRKITPDGTVTTIAGNGNVGSADGTGKSASFNFPQGIAVDNSGNIYVSDTGNDLIRKITPDGTVTTIAGKLAAGNANGTGAQATFNIPQGLVAGIDGKIYVTDAGNNIIRAITPAGVVTTFAGSGLAKAADGTGIQASFDFPNAITTDASGNLYVTEGPSNQVRMITAAAKATALPVIGLAFGQSLPYYDQGAQVPLDMPIWPNGVAYNKVANNLYVADYGNGLVELF